jgi:release factor glutamine methyltransferase
VAIAMARQRPTARVMASDISADALAVARDNAARLGAYNVGFFEGDLFAPFAGERFDVITANPPYIPSGDLATLQPDVRDHEPRLALDGGEDGLVLVRKIVEAAPEHLEADGLLAIEIGAGEGPEAARLLESRGFREVRLDRDIARIERVVSGVMPVR